MAKARKINAENGQAVDTMEATTAVSSTSFINFFDKGHEIPDKRSQFMKLEAGKNRFRFIGEPVSGFVFFGKVEREDGTESVKPYRRRESEGEFSLEEMIERNVRIKKDGEIEGQKYFVLSLVYNYQKEKLQVLEITQKSILKALKSYVESEEYGHPSGYDLTIEKKGDGLNTEYTVIVSPPKPLPEEVALQVSDLSCDLERIFEGEYPLG